MEQTKSIPEKRGAARPWIPPVLGLAWVIIVKFDLVPGVSKLTEVYQLLPLVLGVVGFSACFFMPWTPLEQSLGGITTFLVILKLTTWLLYDKPATVSEPTAKKEVVLRHCSNSEMVIKVWQEGSQPMEVIAELKPCDHNLAAYPGYALHSFTSHEGWNEFTLDLRPLHWSYLQEPDPCIELHMYEEKEDGSKRLMGIVGNEDQQAPANSR
ncbi:MAG TPA: hypothetical protein VK168_16490 [Saprospiraceae bacterium]|nr:hypothetical protein [Saprospiraceae bacterium]